MKIGLGQINCEVGAVVNNTAKICRLISEASAKGCQVVAFPEMSDTGYVVEVIAETASEASGVPCRTIAQAAKDGQIWVCCGLSERIEQRIYNSIFVFSPEGQIVSIYRKLHLFSLSGETRCFTAGSETVTTTIAEHTWGLSICFDLRFPELYRRLVLSGAKILLNCTAWPSARAAHWRTLMSARAIENQAICIGVNRVGTDGGMEFCGNSLVVAPDGREILFADSISDGLLEVSFSPELVDINRQEFPAIRSRRSDIF